MFTHHKNYPSTLTVLLGTCVLGVWDEHTLHKLVEAVAMILQGVRIRQVVCVNPVDRLVGRLSSFENDSYLFAPCKLETRIELLFIP